MCIDSSTNSRIWPVITESLFTKNVGDLSCRRVTCTFKFRKDEIANFQPRPQQSYWAPYCPFWGQRYRGMVMIHNGHTALMSICRLCACSIHEDPRIKKGAARCVLSIVAHNLKDAHFNLCLKISALYNAFLSTLNHHWWDMDHTIQFRNQAPVCPVEEHADSLPANTREQRHSWECNSCSATQEISHILCSVKVHTAYELSFYGKCLCPSYSVNAVVCCYFVLTFWGFLLYVFSMIIDHNRKPMDIQSSDPQSTIVASVWKLS
jgi:hypothetical protein